MIAHLRGRVAARSASTVVVDVNGVGYLVHVTGPDGIPARGSELELHTSLQVREDAMTLYGFTERGALELFELLLTSSGVGPKLALAALGTHAPDRLRAAIRDEDLDTLTQVPGIGRKVAQRLVLELREKVGGGGADVPVPGGDPAAPSPAGDARQALGQLGYTPAEIDAALAHVDVDADADTGTLVRDALRALASGTAVGARR